MLAAGVVAMVLMLGSRGEPPRLEKFRNALLAQSQLPLLPQDSMRTQALQQELLTLTDRRPTLTAPFVFMGIGSLGLISTVALVILGIEASGLAVLAPLFFGLVLGAVGVAFSIIGVAMLGKRLSSQRRTDDRIAEIEAELSESVPPPPPLPTGFLWRQPVGATLARF